MLGEFECFVSFSFCLSFVCVLECDVSPSFSIVASAGFEGRFGGSLVHSYEMILSYSQAILPFSPSFSLFLVSILRAMSSGGRQIEKF